MMDDGSNGPPKGRHESQELWWCVKIQLPECELPKFSLEYKHTKNEFIIKIQLPKISSEQVAMSYFPATRFPLNLRAVPAARCEAAMANNYHNGFGRWLTWRRPSLGAPPVDRVYGDNIRGLVRIHEDDAASQSFDSGEHGTHQNPHHEAAGHGGHGGGHEHHHDHGNPGHVHEHDHGDHGHHHGIVAKGTGGYLALHGNTLHLVKGGFFGLLVELLGMHGGHAHQTIRVSDISAIEFEKHGVFFHYIRFCYPGAPMETGNHLHDMMADNALLMNLFDNRSLYRLKEQIEASMEAERVARAAA